MAKIITEPKVLYGFLTTPVIEVEGILVFANGDVIWISCKYRVEERVPYLRHTNEVIGTCVPAGMRIQLYRYLDRLRENAMYCDKDCVIHIQPRGEHHLIETGDK